MNDEKKSVSVKNQSDRPGAEGRLPLFCSALG